jgi:ABC-type multidrug transport system fused ATPase/permease subunit
MLGSSVASKFLIDAVISYDSGIIGTAAALMLGMRLGSIAMKSVSGRIAARINIRIQNELQSELFGRILRTDWQSLERFRSGDLLNRISSDSGTVAGGVTGFVPSLISGGVQFVGAFFIILYYDPVMALIALIGVPLTGISSAFLVHRMRTHNRQMKEAQADVMSFQQESFQNITTIKAFGITGRYHDRMQEEQRKYAEKYLDFNRFSVWTSALMGLLNLAAYIGCFGWGVYRLWTGGISYGEMTMFLQLSGMLGAAFSSLISLVPAGISVATSAGRHSWCRR